MSASIFAANGLPLAKEEAAPSLGPTMKSTMAAHFERAKQATLRALSDKPAVKGTHYFLFTQAANWPMNSRFKSMTPTSLPYDTSLMCFHCRRRGLLHYILLHSIELYLVPNGGERITCGHQRTQI